VNREPAVSRHTRLILLNRQRKVPIDLRWLRRAAALALPECEAHSDDGRYAVRALDEVVVTLVSDARMAEIHRDFMGIDGPTDVITFEHGEIVVSAETARIYAREFNHPIEWELTLYTIHGLLHLNGFDDLAARPATRMQRVQERILRKIVNQLPSL
jgi:probable rRNA maturation factor